MSDNRKDINVEVRVRNNLILKRMKAKGISSILELSRQSGIHHTTLGLFINMKKPARKKKDDSWYSDVLKLAEFFQCMPEDLFSDRQQHTAIEKNRREAEVTFNELAQITQLTPDRQLELSSEALEFRAVLTRALLQLHPREERVLRMRFGFNLSHEYTLDEIGQQFGVTGSRIMHIEAKALRKLKHPHISRKIRDTVANLGKGRIWYDGEGNEHSYTNYAIDNEVLEMLHFL